MNRTPRNGDVVVPSPAKKRPRGVAFPRGAANRWAFKPGQSGNPGGKPRIHLKFKAKIAQTMLEPASPQVRKVLGLKRNATLYDAMVQALVMNAVAGDNQAFMHCHDIIDGPIVQKRFNVTTSMERFLSDPQFRAFLEEQHGTYLSQIGVVENADGQRTGIPAGSPLHRILGTESGEDE